jgi:uncharacterized protein DUF5985
MATAVYILSALTSLACAVLLLRGYQRQGARLLLWAGVCFFCFTIGNILLIVDMVLLPQEDLAILRVLPVLAGLCALLYGMIWETR